MKIDNVAALVYGLIRKEKQKVESAFSVLIANEKNEGVKHSLETMYDEYKYREGMVVIDDLDIAIRKLVSAPCRDVSMGDLFLPDTIKKETENLLFEWKNQEILLKNGLQATNKVLLEGPPGNGKTSYAIALAKQLGIPLLNTSSSLMLDSYLGQSEKNVTTLFNRLPERCVLFFDEIEAMAASRGKTDSTGKAWNSIVTSFLVNMEQLRPYVLFIAATNRTDLMDVAILRRFDMRMRFQNPTEKEKNGYIAQYLSKYNLSADEFWFCQGAIREAKSFSEVELVLKKKHKEVVLQKLVKQENCE